jgi:hypothetical protein
VGTEGGRLSQSWMCPFDRTESRNSSSRISQNDAAESSINFPPSTGESSTASEAGSGWVLLHSVIAAFAESRWILALSACGLLGECFADK